MNSLHLPVCLVLLIVASLQVAQAMDHQFPAFHVRPPWNWMNDPNGPVVWNGTYHMFYQYNPHGALWGNITWGHASSTNLINWEYHSPILEGTPGTSDEAGVWSGSSLLHKGRVYILYTGAERDPASNYWNQTQSLACSDDEFKTTLKYSGNPVIEYPPNVTDSHSFRDPSFFLEEETNTLLLVLGSKCQGYGCVLLYEMVGEGFVNYNYLHPLYESEVDHDVTYECPDFFKLGNKYVLLYAYNVHNSIAKGNYYMVGSYDLSKRKFVPSAEGVLLDSGNAFYAARTFIGPGADRILIAWAKEERDDIYIEEAGWAGSLTFPRILSLSGDYLQQIFIDPTSIFTTVTTQAGDLILDYPHHLEYFHVGGLFYLTAKILTCSDECYIDVRRGSNGVHYTRIILKNATSTVCVNRTNTYGGNGTDNSTVCGYAPLGLPGSHIEILGDSSVLEILFDGILSLTVRIYPTEDEDGMRMTANDHFRVGSLKLYYFRGETTDFTIFFLLVFSMFSIFALVFVAVSLICLIFVFYKFIYKKMIDREAYAEFLSENTSYDS